MLSSSSSAPPVLNAPRKSSVTDAPSSQTGTPEDGVIPARREQATEKGSVTPQVDKLKEPTLAEQLRQCSLKIQANWIKTSEAPGGSPSLVDYENLEKSEDWREFLLLAEQLSGADNGTTSCSDTRTTTAGAIEVPSEGEDGQTTENLKNPKSVMPRDATERKVFLINLYNVLMMHGLIARRYHKGNEQLIHPLHDNREIIEDACQEISNTNAAPGEASAAGSARSNPKHFFKDTAYLVDNIRLSLDDIEHGLLRGKVPCSDPNTPEEWKVAIGGTSKVVTAGAAPDEEGLSSCAPLDPRIHFALNCGARGCPRIQVYSKQNVETGLNAAAKSFLRAETEVEVVKNEGGVDENNSDLYHLEITLSMLFKWYGQDFGETELDRISFVKKFLEEDSSAKIEEAIAKEWEIRLNYRPYDWSLNVKT
ncbi:unnamed protein product [Amoebophrya sp. A120]|nr:unnamed protein product [Amoebophrya sp. A120]|eukprot:GSA120T00019500001.1